MKKLLTALLCGAALVLSADVLKEWKSEEAYRFPRFPGCEDSGRRRLR